MANKRNLKRCINHICGELLAECIAVSTYSVNVDKENVDSLMKSILHTHSDYIMRVSHPEPGMPAKVYYKNIMNSFVSEVNYYVDHISNLH
ncbi:MAG: hypothetical protein Q4E63_09410 [Prevotellaceae bacterium]|nr:hypothetical protein [Prevotellaceae bacterium]MDO4932840.1 hypothetical protein [Prevotellaceae bacterium]